MTFAISRPHWLVSGRLKVSGANQLLLAADL
jgi:hypothetical protein